MLAGSIAIAITLWARRTGEFIAPFPLVIATLGFYFLSRSAYLLWYDRPPLTSGGLPRSEQLDLIARTLVMGIVAVSSFLIGHSRKSAGVAGSNVGFSLPDPHTSRAVWIALFLGSAGLAAVVYIIRSVGGVSYALQHQYELSAIFQGRLLVFEVARLLIVPAVLLLIDADQHRSRWWAWVVAGVCAVVLYSLGRRSFMALAIGYPVAIYHLTVRRIPLRWLLPSAGLLAVLLFGLGYLRLMRRDRLPKVIAVLSHQPSLALHFLNATGELKVFDAATIVLRDVPNDMPYTYGQTFLRIPWMAVPRALWPDKPATLGNVIVARNLPNLMAGYPPTAVGEFYAAAGPFAVALGFFVVGWLARAGWEWRRRHPGVGNAAAYLMLCFFFFDFTRVGDPSRTVWFFIIGLAFFTAAFCLSARPADHLTRAA